jgi:CarD family transcriptional regulator|nr:CarD family transcriptional regulator [uncultured Lachnoclostridium sp.]
MFQIGDIIIYGTSGVCIIDNIGPIDSPSASKGRTYYTLHPYYSERNTIFTPTDNKKVQMRSILSKEEATSLINNIQEIKCIWANDERGREVEYKEAIKQCDCKQLLKIVKSIYFSRKEKIAEGKKVPARDEKYYHMAEESLYGELALSLGLEIDQVEELVHSKLEEI